MAQYIGEVKGKAGEASRLGSIKSGLCGHMRGWRIGGRVVMEWDQRNERDTVDIVLTGGSNGGSSHGCIRAHKDVDDNIVVDHLSPSLLLALSEQGWDELMGNASADVAQRMRGMLVAYLDKLQGG